MKTIKLTLAVAVLAIGTTAFAFTGHTDPEKKPVEQTTYYYANMGNGFYKQISVSEADPSEHCNDSDFNHCIVTSATNVSTFTLGLNAPNDLTPVPGSFNALYQ